MTEDSPLVVSITRALVAGGYAAWRRFDSGLQPRFLVNEGVGATVNLSWDAGADDRAEVMTRFETLLREAVLPVTNRGNHLYVAAAGQR